MLTKNITLKFGLKIGATVHKDLVMREATAGDMMDAEELAPISKRLQYNTALCAITLVRAGDFEGPFSLQMLRSLKGDDLNRLHEALLDLEQESGEE